MAFTPVQEAQLLALIAQQSQLLSLAGNQTVIDSKLSATKKNLAQVPAATAFNNSDLLLVRQGATDRSITGAIVKSELLLAGQTITTTGTANAYILTPSTPITSYANGQRFRVKWHISGATGSSTVNISGLGTRNIVQNELGIAFSSPEIVADHLADIEFVSSLNSFVVVNPVNYQVKPLPLGSLDFPDCPAGFSVTAQSAGGTGGNILIGAGLIAIGQSVTLSTGVQRSFVTTATSVTALPVNSTVFIRAQIINGVVTFYWQTGTDFDVAPGSFKGTPNALSGGGFDSTTVDALIAKVTTGVTGSLPVINATFFNRKNLFAYYKGQINSGDYTADSNGNFGGSVLVQLNWARTPYVDLFTRASDGAINSGITATDYYVTKEQVATSSVVTATGLVFNKTYVLTRYQVKIPVFVSFVNNFTPVIGDSRFELLVRDST